MRRIFSLCDTMSNSKVNPCHTCSTETKHRQVSIWWHWRGTYKYRPDYRHNGRILSVKSPLDEGGTLSKIDGICAFSLEINISDLSPNFFTMFCLHMPYTGSTRDSHSKSIFVLFVFLEVTKSLV